jgi:hypothetical protein
MALQDRHSHLNMVRFHNAASTAPKEIPAAKPEAEMRARHAADLYCFVFRVLPLPRG